MPEAIEPAAPPRNPRLLLAGLLGTPVILLAVLMFNLPQGSVADYPWYETSEELVASADAVVLGEIVAEREDRFEGNSYRVVTVSVEWDGKGAHASGAEVEVKLLAGSGPAADPPLELNGRYILFIEEYDDVPASLLNPWQGYYEVRGTEIIADEDNPVVLHRQLLLALGLR